jgi:uncharacterized protein (TIGR02246 family)
MIVLRRHLVFGAGFMAIAAPAFARTAGATFMGGNNGAAGLGQLYADAWSAHDPAAVAAFFASDGSISVNGGTPSIGRAAIAAMAQGFYDLFPDVIVRMDDFRRAGASALFAWTLEGHHSQTRSHVQVSGWEEWQLAADGLVAQSKGHFDANDYQRQIETGV